jgi:hypothetical protein
MEATSTVEPSPSKPKHRRPIARKSTCGQAPRHKIQAAQERRRQQLAQQALVAVSDSDDDCIVIEDSSEDESPARRVGESRLVRQSEGNADSARGNDIPSDVKVTTPSSGGEVTEHAYASRVGPTISKVLVPPSTDAASAGTTSGDVQRVTPKKHSPDVPLNTTQSVMVVAGKENKMPTKNLRGDGESDAGKVGSVENSTGNRASSIPPSSNRPEKGPSEVQMPTVVGMQIVGSRENRTTQHLDEGQKKARGEPMANSATGTTTGDSNQAYSGGDATNGSQKSHSRASLEKDSNPVSFDDR